MTVVATGQSGSTAIYDPYTADFQRDPYSVYRVLRDEHPVYHNPERRFWALSRFDDVWEAVHDPATFSSSVEETKALLPMIIYLDPPRHDQLRGLLSKAFTPKRIAALEGRIRTLSRELVDGFVTTGSADVIRDLAQPMPAMVISELIGIPADRREDFQRWTAELVATDQDAKSPKLLEVATNIYGCFADLLAERQAHRRDDLMSALVNAEIDGQGLTEEELLGFCFLLVVAGNDTTTNLIGNGSELLAGHPDQRARLVRQAALRSNGIEEMLRFEPPAQALPRTATRDVTLHGVTIPAGSRVLLLWASANRDEREFGDADRFDVGREIPRHLTFGHGAHYCLGAALARLEGRAAFDQLLDRLPDYEVVGQPARITSHWARAFESLPIAFEPRPAP
jgi:cytochrome P450